MNKIALSLTLNDLAYQLDKVAINQCQKPVVYWKVSYFEKEAGALSFFIDLFKNSKKTLETFFLWLYGKKDLFIDASLYLQNMLLKCGIRKELAFLIASTAAVWLVSPLPTPGTGIIATIGTMLVPMLIAKPKVAWDELKKIIDAGWVGIRKWILKVLGIMVPERLKVELEYWKETIKPAVGFASRYTLLPVIKLIFEFVEKHYEDMKSQVVLYKSELDRIPDNIDYDIKRVITDDPYFKGIATVASMISYATGTAVAKVLTLVIILMRAILTDTNKKELYDVLLAAEATPHFLLRLIVNEPGVRERLEERLEE